MSEGTGPADRDRDGDAVVPGGGGFDLAHLQAVHRRLFHGVDPDAGRLRIEDPPTTPGGGEPPDGQVVMVVPARHIRTAGGKVLDVLDRAGLRGLRAGTVAAVLAELYLDLHVLRPFQAGNDETIRVFLGELADDAGYRIDWTAVPPTALPGAAGAGDPDPLRVILQGAVHPIDPTGTGARRKRRQVHALVDTLREVADQLRPPTDPPG